MFHEMLEMKQSIEDLQRKVASIPAPVSRGSQITAPIYEGAERGSLADIAEHGEKATTPLNRLCLKAGIYALIVTDEGPPLVWEAGEIDFRLREDGKVGMGYGFYEMDPEA